MLSKHLMDFAKGIVNSAVDEKTAQTYIYLYIFYCFSFVLVANMVGLIIFIHYEDHSYLASPTAAIVVLFSLSANDNINRYIILVYRRWDSKDIFNILYLSPMSIMLPIKLIEEFTNTITLAFRLYGNIYAAKCY